MFFNSNYKLNITYLSIIEPKLNNILIIKKSNASADYNSAKENLGLIIDDFIKADIDEFKEFIILQNNWRDEIINSFIKYKSGRMNSGVAEFMNHTVSTLIYNTKGIRDSERRRNRIMSAVNKEGFIIK